MNTSFSQIENLYDAFSALIEQGDEQAVRTFLLEHIHEFPKEVRERIQLAFLAEGISKVAEEAHAISDLQNDALAAIKTLSQEKAMLEDRIKEIELKKSLDI